MIDRTWEHLRCLARWQAMTLPAITVWATIFLIAQACTGAARTGSAQEEAPTSHSLEWAIIEADLESQISWSVEPGGEIEVRLGEWRSVLCPPRATSCEELARRPTTERVYRARTFEEAERIVTERGAAYHAITQRVGAEYHGLPRDGSPMDKLFWAMGREHGLRERWFTCSPRVVPDTERRLRWLARRYGARYEPGSFQQNCARGARGPSTIDVGRFVEGARRWTCEISDTRGTYCCDIECRASDGLRLEESH